MSGSTETTASSEDREAGTQTEAKSLARGIVDGEGKW